MTDCDFYTKEDAKQTGSDTFDSNVPFILSPATTEILSLYRECTSRKSSQAFLLKKRGYKEKKCRNPIVYKFQ